jgi:2-oxoisovalerate dehydrogenase E2 component (dihydrolipoyl transacylase)
MKEEFRRREGVDLTYVPFVIKAATEALREHPILNSAWSEEGIVVKKRIHIGVAVGVEEGLMVPVIRDADQLSISGLTHAVQKLTDRARAGRLSLEDVQGGTFTVNNTGAFGSQVSMPIINLGQAAIVSMEAIVKKPVVVGDAIAIRHILNLCLSFDHRVTDGAAAGGFLQAMKKRLEAMGPDMSLY